MIPGSVTRTWESSLVPVEFNIFSASSHWAKASQSQAIISVAGEGFGWLDLEKGDKYLHGARNLRDEWKGIILSDDLNTLRLHN
jgi:hypothetical protein